MSRRRLGSANLKEARFGYCYYAAASKSWGTLWSSETQVEPKDGQVYISDGSESPKPALLTYVLVFASELVARTRNPNKFFLIKAAHNVPYRMIDSVIEQLRNAKIININLVTEQKEKRAS